MKARKHFEKNWWDASLREVLSFKWTQWKSDTRQVVLWFIEMILAVGIGASIAVYLDPDWNVVPFPWNVGAFLILLGMAVWVHARTKPYRVARKLAKSKK